MMEDRARSVASASVLETDTVEAWGIAVDLIADLGAADAIAWARDYMNDLDDDDRPNGKARWRLVTDAIAEITQNRLH